MAHTISVDDATFATLKKLANKNGRTIVGQLRWFLNNQDAISKAVDPYTFTPSDNGSEDIDEPSEFQQLYNRLQYLDEESSEYKETLSKLSKLQKNS